MDPKIRVLADRLIVDGLHYIQAALPSFRPAVFS